MTLPLLFLVAVVLQIFFIDNQIFALVSRGHRQVLQEAFRQNGPRTSYQVRQVRLPSRDHQVPVVRLFGVWGGQSLDQGSLRIRNPGSETGKVLSIGAGTQTSLVP